MRETMVESVANYFAGVAVLVVVFVRPRNIVDENGGDGGGMLGHLGVGIYGVVYHLGRGNIPTCGRGTSNVRKEECEDEYSEVDHRENVGDVTVGSLAWG